MLQDCHSFVIFTLHKVRGTDKSVLD